DVPRNGELRMISMFSRISARKQGGMSQSRKLCEIKTVRLLHLMCFSGILCMAFPASCFSVEWGRAAKGTHLSVFCALVADQQFIPDSREVPSWLASLLYPRAKLKGHNSRCSSRSKANTEAW